MIPSTELVPDRESAGEEPTTNYAQLVARTWNRKGETLAQAEGRIHDGARDLVLRADTRVKLFFDLFSYALPRSDGCSVMEIGSGVGYIMEAMGRRLDAERINSWRIDGLDIAGHMIAKAKQRIGHDSRYGFVHYDGITVPVPDGSYDLIYSVAALQHIPKEFVYNLFFESFRLLKPNGLALIHVPSFKHLAHIKAHGQNWKAYNDAQIRRMRDPWMFFYSAEELSDVLKIGVGFQHVQIVQVNTALYACVAKIPPWDLRGQ